LRGRRAVFWVNVIALRNPMGEAEKICTWGGWTSGHYWHQIAIFFEGGGGGEEEPDAWLHTGGSLAYQGKEWA